MKLHQHVVDIDFKCETAAENRRCWQAVRMMRRARKQTISDSTARDTWWGTGK